LGSDIYLFGRLKGHEDKIREVLKTFDYYACECERDVTLARKYGFAGTVLPVIPNAGGVELDRLEQLKAPGPVSARKRIMLKGYQHWAGRALVGLRALSRCAELLKDYEIVIYSASPDTIISTELFEQATHVRTNVLPPDTPHDEIMRYHGSARISIGLSISDALSTSSIEALAMGAFPIQSNTSCIDEWIENGRTGFSVPPEDPDAIEKALRRALADDNLVNEAAQTNARLARMRLDAGMLQNQIINIYKEIAEKGS
jgi:glycosyltransferase involved in cell wall biosynthesis